MPGLAVVFAPLTLLAGPAVSYNLAALLLPALAAWSAYRLCLHLTGSLWASLVGGYLFGFSSFVLGQQLEGHLQLTGSFLVPLLGLVVVRFVQGELSAGGFALRFGLLLAAQFTISTEVTFTFTVALAVALALAFWLVREARARLARLALPLAGGYGLAALLASPLLVYALLGFHGSGFTASESSDTDLLDLVVPTHQNALAGSALHAINTHFSDVESGLFLGWPALVIIGLYAWRGRRSPWARVLVACLLLAILVALGTALELDGRRLVTLPWALSRHIPGFDNASPPRYALYASLAAAVIVALWTARTRGRFGRRPALLPLLAVAVLVPAAWQSAYVSQPQRPAFFADGLDASCGPPGETYAVFPFGFATDSMLWQAEAGFRFDLAGGYLWPLVAGSNPVSRFDTDEIVYALNFESDEVRPTVEGLLAFAAGHRVARFVTLAGSGYPSAAQLARIGPVERIGGVLVAPACGSPPLTARNLSADLSAEQRGVDIGYCLDGSYYAYPATLYPVGALAGAVHADWIAGKGLACTVPAGYRYRGYVPQSFGAPPDTYPYYTP